MRLSIVVPACNEERRIGRMLDAYLPYFTQRYGSGVELVVVVNGSTDGTERVVREYQARYPALRMIVDPNRIGKGGALIKGFEAARGELVGFCDADGATPPESWQALVDNLGEADCVIASRWRRESLVSPRQPFLRRLSSRVFNLVTRLFFGLRFTDTQCGAKLMRAGALRQVLPSLTMMQQAFDVDLLLQLKRAGRTIREIPTAWCAPEGGRPGLFPEATDQGAALVRLRMVHSPLRGFVPLYDRYIGRFVHPPQMESDRLFRHSMLMMAGAQIGNVLNLVFQFAMMWMLSNRDYGVMAAMMGFLTTARAPFGAFGQTLSHYISTFLKEGSRPKVNGVVHRALRDVLTVSVVLVAGMLLGGAGALRTFYRLESLWPVALIVVILIVNFYGIIAGSALNGVQAFVWNAVMSVAWGIVRLVASVALVAFGAGVFGALMGVAIAQAACNAIGFHGLQKAVGTVERCPDGATGFYSYCLKYVAASVAFSFFMIGDSTIVKHYFSAESAGLFAKVATVARIVIFLPAPIATVLFPKVVSGGATERGHIRSLFKAAALTASMVFPAALVCSLFPSAILHILTRLTDPQAVPLLRGMVWAMCPISLLQVIMMFELAQRRFAVGGVLLAGAAAYVGLSIFWHGSLTHIPWILLLSGTVTLALAVAQLPWKQLRVNAA